MKVDYLEETAVRKALTFEIDAEIVEKEISGRAKDYARKVKLPGFRVGKIPPDIVRKRFKDVIFQDAAEALVNKHVFHELEGRGLKPVAAPKITELKLEDHQPMTFKAVFEVLPLVEVPDHHGLQVKTRAPMVPEEAVDAEIERDREQQARFDPVESRSARAGDHVLLDVAWKPAGGGQGGRQENTLLEVGSDQNHADINSALEGINPGEVKALSVAYASDHPSPGLAGHTFEYTLTAKGLKTKHLPDVDDELAKDLGADSLAELRLQIRKRMQTFEERRIERELKEALVEEYLKRASFEVPEALIERHLDARLEAAARGLYLQGVDPTKIGMDWKKYRESRREEAAQAAKADILLDELARKQGLEATDEDLDAELAKLAEKARKGKDAVRAQMEKDGEIAALRARIRESKVLDLLKADARLAVE